MFGLAKNKIFKALDNKNNELKLLQREYEAINRKLININIILDSYTEIKNSKKNILKIIVVGFSSIFMGLIFSSASFVICLSLLFAMAITMEVAYINDNKKLLNGNDIDENDYSLLLKDKDSLYNRSEVLRYNIELKKKTVERYNKVLNDMEKVSTNQHLLKSDLSKTDKVASYFLEKPMLVFDTIEEYRNYMFHDDSFIKKELIKSKILEKKKNQ